MWSGASRGATRRTRPFGKWGLPLVLFVGAGGAGLSAFLSARFDAADARLQRRSERSAELAAAHSVIMSKLSPSFENKPIVREPAAPPASPPG